MCQHGSLHYPDNPKANKYPSNCDNLVDENPADHSDLIKENPNDGDDLANDYYSNQDEAHEPDDIDLDEIEWDDQSDLDIMQLPMINQALIRHLQKISTTISSLEPIQTTNPSQLLI
ncbi:hypothetical protein PGT21_015518 [Puccinia graminis f. sp. tritici]|uniref:Uncharacterized protein n=1 Tax=Puccinia graminis f. sp. tritici TaxID=56615 RepID=A0A5B0Q2Z5_PUCGR|nr:hypothetical protein PGT21_015518 [Puccinia graminis f. sp. tritici]